MDKYLILKKIKEHYNFKTDAEFAHFLDITPQNLKHWYNRNTFNISVLVTKCQDINSEWILSGEGEMLKNGEQNFSPADGNLDSITMPREVWQVIQDQAASLRAKDESLKIKDRQVSEVIALLKQQMKRGEGEDVVGQSHAAKGAELG